MTEMSNVASDTIFAEDSVLTFHDLVEQSVSAVVQFRWPGIAEAPRRWLRSE